MNRTSVSIAALATLLLCGLPACGGTPATDSGRALVAASHRWMAAVNGRDAATLRATMTDGVQLLDTSGTTANGPDAAIEALRAYASRGRLTATTRELTIDGDVAWHVVDVVMTRKNGDLQSLGRVLEIWKRANGAWRLHRRLAATVGAPPELLTRPPPDVPVLDRPTN